MSILTLTPTEVTAQLRIPGDLFRTVNPRTFAYPQVTAQRHDTVYTVTANVDGVPEAVDLLNTIDVDPAALDAAVAQFNADPIAAWTPLLSAFFREQRAANAARRADLDADEAFLLDLEAGFLR